MPMTLGSHLKSIRVRAGHSLREIERRSGYTMGYIIAIEKGRRVPSPFALTCIMDSLDVDDEQRQMATDLLLETAKIC